MVNSRNSRYHTDKVKTEITVLHTITYLFCLRKLRHLHILGHKHVCINKENSNYTKWSLAVFFALGFFVFPSGWKGCFFFSSSVFRNPPCLDLLWYLFFGETCFTEVPLSMSTISFACKLNSKQHQRKDLFLEWFESYAWGANVSTVNMGMSKFSFNIMMLLAILHIVLVHSDKFVDKLNN